jgi:glycosyltransferase involved in cell wall biosynthesis
MSVVKIAPLPILANASVRHISTGTPYLVILKGAPIYQPEDHVAYHAETLSKQFEGEIWFGGKAAHESKAGRFTLHGVAMESFGVTEQFRRLLPAVAASIKRHRSDRSRNVIVVAYDPLTQGLMGRILSLRFGVPMVVEIPGNYASLGTYAGETSQLRKWLKRRRNLTIARYVMRRASIIRELHPGQAEAVCGRTSWGRTEPYFDGIRLDRFQSDDTNRELIALFVGYPFLIKGGDVLIEAWRRVCVLHPSWRLKVIGWGASDHISPEDAHSLRIDVMTAKSNIELAEDFKRASIFILPSRSEAMGRVLLEAGAAGLARIASRTGGIPTIVTDEVDGLLVEPGSVDDLAAALHRVLSDKALRETLADAARSSVEMRFSADRYVNDMARCIGRLERKTKTGMVT